MKNKKQMAFALLFCGVLMSFALPTRGPELPIRLIYKKWVITAIDPTGMPTWSGLSSQAQEANHRVNRKMIERGSYYEFTAGGKANILVYNPFTDTEFLDVPTTYTYSKAERYITLQSNEQKASNSETFRVPEMAYKVEKLSENELVLVVVKNNYKLIFKPAPR